MNDPAQSDLAIRISGLKKRFHEKRVLQGLDLEIPRGMVFGYIGPNGAGKTTTVKILAGLDRQFDGEVEVAGFDVRSDPREVKRRIGFVAESAALYEGLTAWEFLELIGRMRSLSDRVIAHRAGELLKLFDLGSRAHTRLGSFSKGMRQKVLLSAALLDDPEILFLDEPLSGLDVASTILVKDLIRSLANAGKTIFYCSHMMDVVERVCDRIVILNDGVVAADGSFEELAHGERDRSLEQVFSSLTGQRSQASEIEHLLQAFDPDQAR
ncbi:MAG: ABC transporter ATP-binding protein [Planctomycetota bacterium]